jgi:8-oxo-dGTP pyrophosphatase MutT (NUDIX family)
LPALGAEWTKLLNPELAEGPLTRSVRRKARSKWGGVSGKAGPGSAGRFPAYRQAGPHPLMGQDTIQLSPNFNMNNGLLHSAAIVIKDAKLLLTKRPDNDDSEPGKWCPINETIEDGETPEAAVVRGAKEEMGLDFTITKQLPGYSLGGHTAFVFLGETKDQPQPNPVEVSEYRWVSHEESKTLEIAYGYDRVAQYLFEQGLIK